MTRIAILVRDDETWFEAEETRLYWLTKRQLEELESGVLPKDVSGITPILVLDETVLRELRERNHRSATPW